MKITSNMIFGGVSALAGLAALYYTRKKALQGPDQINILPPLSNAPSYAPGQPTANGASIPAFYASPFQVTPDLVAQSTGAPVQVPYQVYNLPPSHVESKQRAQQSAPITSQQTVIQKDSGGCGCGGNCDSYGTRINVPATFGPSETRNMNGVGLRPIGVPKIGVGDSVYAPLTSFNLATQQTVPAVYAISNAGQTLIGNVPSVN